VKLSAEVRSVADVFLSPSPNTNPARPAWVIDRDFGGVVGELVSVSTEFCNHVPTKPTRLLRG
jgi:hypothetical protein